MLFRDVWLDGSRRDLRIRGGRVAEVGAARTLAPLPGEDGAPERVVEGGLVCPPFAEPHVHLDAALLAPRAPNRSGTLAEGIANWARLRDGLDADDLRERALTVVRWAVGWGVTRIRTHVDTGHVVAVRALLALRRELRAGVPGLRTAAGDPVPVELQVVAFPQEGVLRAPGRREAWEAAVALGCDAVGAIPHHERTAAEGAASVRLAFDLARRHGVGVDLHCDETDDPASRFLGQVAALTLDHGLGGAVVAGHCTSLHSQPDAYAAKVVALVAEAGVQVVANPLDNIVLQGRFDGYPKRRGITRVDALWAAGAPVGIGHDSVMDPWYPLGTANPVDAAAMLVHAAHLTGADEMRRVFAALSGANHLPFGGPPGPIAPGGPATLLHFDAADPVEVLRLRPRPTLYLRGSPVEGPPPGRLPPALDQAGAGPGMRGEPGPR